MQRMDVPVALQKRVLQVECPSTLPLDGPAGLPAVQSLYNTCGLTMKLQLRKGKGLA